MALKRFFISPETVQAANPAIHGSDARHMCRVLRLTAGDEVELFDGTGTCYRARITTASPERVGLQTTKVFPCLAESPLIITLAQGFLKERKMAELIRPLTELGIHCWIPFTAARSVSLPDKKRFKTRLARWEKIAVEAVKQCRRGRIPRIEPAESLQAVLGSVKDSTLKLLCDEGEKEALHPPQQGSPKPSSVLVLVGPEGGFTPEEVALARTHGAHTVGLGPRVLRAQTAALAACALVQHNFGDMGIQ